MTTVGLFATDRHHCRSVLTVVTTLMYGGNHHLEREHAMTTAQATVQIGSPEYDAQLHDVRQLPYAEHYDGHCRCYRCDFARAAAAWAAEYTGWTEERWATQRAGDGGSARENAAYLLAEAAATLARDAQ